MKNIIIALALLLPQIAHADGGAVGGATASKFGLESSSPTLRGTWNFLNCITVGGQAVCAPSAASINAGTQPIVSTVTANSLNFAAGGSTITSKGTLTISTAATSQTATPNIFISGNGNVGIGKGNPQLTLDVNGQVGSTKFMTANGVGGFLPGISSACASSQFFDAQRVDGGIITGGTCNPSAGVTLTSTQTFTGTNTFANVVNFSSATVFGPAIGQPTSAAGQAIIYYDSVLGGLAMTQNGESGGHLIPDPAIGLRTKAVTNCNGAPSTLVNFTGMGKLRQIFMVSGANIITPVITIKIDANTFPTVSSINMPINNFSSVNVDGTSANMFFMTTAAPPPAGGASGLDMALSFKTNLTITCTGGGGSNGSLYVVYETQ